MARSEQLDWDGFRLVLAIGRGGGLAAAGRALGLNHATVFRRVNALEAKLTAPLFERHRNGYALTPLGRTVFSAAERMEEEVLAVDGALPADAKALRGTIRVTAPDDIAQILLMPILKRFMALHRGIKVELIVTGRNLSLPRREADIAIRATANPPQSMTGLKIGPIGMALYAARGPSSGQNHDLRQSGWVGWEESEALPGARLMARLGFAQHDGNVVFRCSSLLQQYAAVRAGIGIGILPCFLADSDPELIRLQGPQPEGAEPAGAGLWLLTHPNLKGQPRIRAFLEFAAAELRQQRERLAGKSAAGVRRNGRKKT